MRSKALFNSHFDMNKASTIRRVNDIYIGLRSYEFAKFFEAVVSRVKRRVRFA
jgi:hypothetical protein